MSAFETGAAPKEPLSQEARQEQEQRVEKIVSCDLCGAPMLDLHCKLICRQCGFKRDCSDP